MKRTILVALAALPLAAFAQGAGPGPGPGPGAGPGSRWGRNGQGPDSAQLERLAKRMRLARTLGLAEALDLDATQALKLGETAAKYDDRRLAANKQMFEAFHVLRRAARGEKLAPAEVDQAIQKTFEARAQVMAINREAFAAISKDLSPDKKARALIFFARFHARFGPRAGRMMTDPGMGPGMMRGRGQGGGMGPGAGMGQGQGPMGMMGGAPPYDGGPWNDDDED